MQHIKTLNTKNLQNTVKKAAAASARHHVSPHARHPVQWKPELREQISRATGNVCKQRCKSRCLFMQ